MIVLYTGSMCGRYGFTFTDNEQVWRRFNLSNEPELDTSYNIAPSQEALVVTRNSPNKGEKKKFGVEAPWNDKQLIINAQAETVAEKRTFKPMLRESRCLVPASFFFEWKRLVDGKQAYAFSRKDDAYFSFAGIYHGDGFIILTTKPNHLMEPVHNRMPCILTEEQEEEWLNPDTTEEQLQKLLVPFPDSEMKQWAVSSLVNTPKNNFPEILKEFEE